MTENTEFIAKADEGAAPPRAPARAVVGLAMLATIAAALGSGLALGGHIGEPAEPRPEPRRGYGCGARCGCATPRKRPRHDTYPREPIGPTVRDETNPKSAHFIGPPEPTREQKRRMRQAAALRAKRGS